MSYDPAKYRPGLGRDVPAPKRAHLYTLDGGCMDFDLPMCRHGWNRDDGESYSIWRGNVGSEGICKICIRRANAGLEGVKSKFMLAVEKLPRLKPCPKCTGELEYMNTDGFVGCLNSKCDFVSEAAVKESVE